MKLTEADDPDSENIALHNMCEIQCLQFLYLLRGIIRFGFMDAIPQ